MDRQELSEVVFGLCLEKRISPSMLKPEWFAPPYGEGVKILLQDGAEREDVAKALSSAYISDAHDAVARWNGIGDRENFDWVAALRSAYENDERGRRLEKIGKKLQKNEDVDILAIYGELGAAIAQDETGLRPLEDIRYGEYKPFKQTGYAPIDKTLGGIPTDGPVIILALTGIGKSRFAAGLINALLHKYPNERGAVYTLEMPADHWTWRTVNLFPDLKELIHQRLFISGSVRDIEELVAEVTAKKVNYVVLDDIDNIVKNNDASEYERVYRRIKEVCRFMGIPVFVLAQPNRMAKLAISSGERFPGKYDAAWSGASENSAALFLALHTCNAVDMESEEFPTSDTTLDYIIAWKSRDGWPGDYDPSKAIGPGAIIMEHSSNWQGSPHGGRWRLWPVNSGGKAIGKKKKSRKDDD